MADNKLIDIKGLEVVYEDILTTLKDNYVKTSEIQSSKRVPFNANGQTIEPDYGNGFQLLRQVVVEPPTSGTGESQELNPDVPSTTISAGYYANDINVSVKVASPAPTITSLDESGKGGITATASTGFYDQVAINVGKAVLNKSTISPSTTAQEVSITEGYTKAGKVLTVEAMPKGSITVGRGSSDEKIYLDFDIVEEDGQYRIKATTNEISEEESASSGGINKITVEPGYVDASSIKGNFYYPVEDSFPLEELPAAKLQLKAENIKAGSSIFGVDGTFSETTKGATPEDILEGKEAFVNGTKVTGNIANVSVTDPAPDLTLGDLIDPSSRFLEITPDSLYNTPTIKALTPGYLGKGPFSADGFKNYIVVNPMAKAEVTLEGTATDGAADITANSGLLDFTTTTPTDYYVELKTTPGSVTPDLKATKTGYMGSKYEMEGNITKTPTDVPVNGNGSKIYFQVATTEETKAAIKAAFN